jgi:hypothetical protein
MIDLTDVLHVPGASTVITRSLLAHSLRNAVNIMESAPVLLVLVEMTAQYRSAARWPMARGGHRERGNIAIVKTVGKGSTAMSAPAIRHAML